jgi:Amt family ammonium transporter
VSKIHRVNPPATPVDETALRLLADDNPAGMIVHQQHTPLYVNAAWAETHGYSVEEVMTMPTLLDLLAPHERDRMQADVADCLAGSEAPLRHVYQALHRDGSRLWVEALAKPVSWQGEPAMMSTVTHVDVERDPERNAVTERVHRDRQLYMAVLSQVPDRISVIDAQYRYRFANRSNLEFHGLSLEELIGRHVQDVIGPEHFARARPDLDRALRGDVVNSIQDVKLFDGGAGWVDVCMRPFRRDGRHIEGVLVTMRDATQMHRAAEALAKSEARLRSLIEHVPTLVFLKDRRGRFQEVNPEFLRVYGLERADVLERTVHELFPPQTATGFASHDRQVMEDAAASQREVTIDGADGAHTYHTSKFPVLDETGAVAGVGGIAVDVTEQRRRLDALLDRERRMSELLGNLPGMIHRARVHDGIAHTEFVSDGCLALTGYRPEEACAAARAFVTAITHPDDRRRTRESITAARVAGRPFQLRYRIVTRSGEVRWVWEQGRATPLPDGAVIHEGFIFDIGESPELSQRLEQQARHDPLTDLLNRRAFEELLDEVVARNRESGREAALLYLDLDRFKVVNDACGHAAGDELLRQLTGRMKAAVRQRDVLARLGGDEFALLLEHCDTDHALQVADKLRIAVQEFRFVWHRRVFGVSASIGVVPITPDSGSAGELLVRAENACFAAKDAGRDRLYVYRSDDPGLDRLCAQTRWLGRIETALNDDALVLLADPVVALSRLDGAPDHYEVLARIHDEEGGLVSPAGFMPVAERHGLAARIDRWVVRRALERLADTASVKRVSISLSERTIDDAGFPDFVRRELLRTGVDGEQLGFGVSEIFATRILSSAGEFTEAIRRQGCPFCLDDFGSGVASFSHLESLPVEYVKLRGALVRELKGDRAARAVVKTISDIGRALGKRIIAAEVDDAATLAQVREAGVDLAQGRALGASQALDELR